MSSEKPSVLVVVLRCGPKMYCNDFYPEYVKKLDYPNKEILLVNEENCPALRGEDIGDKICGIGRQFGIEYARKNGFDYVYFQDLDLEPDPDLLSRLVESGHPLIGPAIACRGNAYYIIGHNYINDQSLERVPIYYPELKDGDEVGGIGGCSLLVHKDIFSKVDFSGYSGVNVLPNRSTCDDEYFQIKVWEALKIRPRALVSVGGWHYHSDGYKYRLLGKKELWG